MGDHRGNHDKHVVSKRCRYWDGSGGSETNNGAWVGERMFVEVEEEVGSGKKVVCTLYTKGHKVIESK